MAPQPLANGVVPIVTDWPPTTNGSVSPTNSYHASPTNSFYSLTEQHWRSLLHNDSSRPWVVQKFGGTSVGKAPTVIAEGIVCQWLRGHQVALVCSARSTESKREGTTQRLIDAAKAAEQGGHYGRHVSDIQADHLAQADELLHDATLRADVCRAVADECADLAGILGAAARLGEVSDSTRDLIVSKGERLACVLMAGLLRDRGVDARYVDLSDAVAAADGPQDLNEAWYARITDALTRRVRDCGAQVPVLTGFFGRVEGGLLARAGRGYTDLCAALVAVGLGAAELQVWKEVDGIFTANPAKVPTARLLAEISPEEAAELTFYGSEVIHPFTMEQVIRAAIPIRIRNVLNLRNPGTLIRPQALPASRPVTPADGEVSDEMTGSMRSDKSAAPNVYARSPTNRRLRSGSASYFSQSMGPDNVRPKRPTAVTVKPNILVLNVLSNKRSLSHGFYARIFSVLDRYRLSVDLISSSEVHVSMALHSEKALQSSGRGSSSSGVENGVATKANANGDAGLDGVAEIEAAGTVEKVAAGSAGRTGEDGEQKLVEDVDVAGAVQELRQYGTVDVVGNMAILSLVGRNMSTPGIAGRMFGVLGANNVNIEMISQGSSEINISCVIEEREADRALNVLHTELFYFLD